MPGPAYTSAELAGEILEHAQVLEDRSREGAHLHALSAAARIRADLELLIAVLYAEGTGKGLTHAAMHAACSLNPTRSNRPPAACPWRNPDPWNHLP